MRNEGEKIRKACEKGINNIIEILSNYGKNKKIGVKSLKRCVEWFFSENEIYIEELWKGIDL